MNMNGALYIYLQGVDKEERIKCAKEHVSLHTEWFDYNLEQTVKQNFLHTNEYKLLQDGRTILFCCMDIEIQFSYLSDQIVFGFHL